MVVVVKDREAEDHAVVLVVDQEVVVAVAAAEDRVVVNVVGVADDQEEVIVEEEDHQTVIHCTITSSVTVANGLSLALLPTIPSGLLQHLLLVAVVLPLDRPSYLHHHHFPAHL